MQNHSVGRVPGQPTGGRAAEARRPVFLFLQRGQDTLHDSDELIESLRSHYFGYPSLAKRLPFDDAFEFIELDYQAFFRDVRERWRRDAPLTAEALRAGGVPDRVLEPLLAMQQAGTRGEVIEPLLDFVQYRFLRTVRASVQAAIARRIHAVLEGRPAIAAGNWAVVAHSLGTSIAHDTLHGMYRKPLGGGRQLVASKTFMSVVMMVANTSRLLEKDADVYRSMVRPMARLGGGICEWYLNVRHEWDPITMPKPFEPVLGWPTPDAGARLRLISVRHFLDHDIHSLQHYMEDPSVHVPLFEGMTGLAVSQRERWEARDLFTRRSDIYLFERLREELKQTHVGREEDWGKILPAWAAFASLTRSADSAVGVERKRA